MPLFTGINVVSIPVADLEDARRFYGDVLELGRPLYDLPEAGWVEWASPVPGGGNVAVTLAEPGWQPTAGTTIVFNTADCHAAVTALRARGVRCDDPVVFPGFVVYATFYDPWGNRLQMASAAPAGA
jgi:predicted enzyme related to lactoylglutathione lyase